MTTVNQLCRMLLCLTRLVKPSLASRLRDHAHRASMITTARTRLREMLESDAAFICTLLNEPSFLRFIGDRNVRTTDEATTFITTRYQQSYRDHGFGLYLVELRETNEPIGICGLVHRAELSAPDLGFAFLPAHEGQGPAHEAALATLRFARSELGLQELWAIANLDNVRSHKLLERLNFQRESSITLVDGLPMTLFALRAASPVVESRLSTTRPDTVAGRLLLDGTARPPMHLLVRYSGPQAHLLSLLFA